MVLHALEFSDCLLDSPHFREKLNAHEKELESTSKVVKKLISEGNELIKAARNYAKCQRTFAQTLKEFKFETIGSQQTDDEVTISESLKNFGELILSIEDARDTMLQKTKETFVDRLEDFRKQHIHSAKEAKKRYEKMTKQYCACLEKNLSVKPTKVAENQIQELDTTVEQERHTFQQEALAYVMKLQEVQERKKFEFVETLLSFMCGWKTFYHQGYDIGSEMEPYLSSLTCSIQKTRENFESTRDEATTLMNKMIQGTDGNTTSKMFTRQGYLYAMEKKALGAVAWTKYFCSYSKDTKIFTMIPFNQTTSNAGKLNLTPDTMLIESCIRRATDSIDRRFCFDVSIKDRPNVLTLQALSDTDRQAWLEAMDGKEPVYAQPPIIKDSQEYVIDEIGNTFVRKCITAVESRGLTDQGLYRVVGVSSKVNKLMQHGLDPKRIDSLNLSDPDCEYEIKTITSALKNYFRKLAEPLMTFKFHQKLIAAAKLDNVDARRTEISSIITKLPKEKYEMLKSLMHHLKQVSNKHQENLMNVSNLSVCFGPTLLRPEEETVAAIMDIKFCNVVVEILIENYDMIFEGKSSNQSSNSVQMRQPLSKGGLPQNSYSEASTYGKHRTNYRANSVYATRLSYENQSTAAAGMLQAGDNDSYAVPLHKLSPTVITKQNLSGNRSGSSSPDSASDQRLSVLYSGNSRPTKANSSSPSVNLTSNNTKRQQVYSMYPNLQTTENHNMLPAPTDYRNSLMSQSYSGSPSPQPATHQPLHSLHLSHGPGTLSKLLRGVSRTTRRSRSKSSTRSQSNSTKSQHPGPGAAAIHRRVRTLYACEAENESELSFEPNVIIYNVKESREPGWLEGTLNGKTGLIPANYIEYIN